eukprot:TRINITY_DN4032_c0_g2_i1.p2 TRINITY_DN4032_c0_g2~~TRINITY_DN4032_c0_g2_i1.p2  ORF type:complete len:127 (-),score=4.03 TRINITY_DN4032_c0_g2_i1:103-483(-)
MFPFSAVRRPYSQSESLLSSSQLHLFCSTTNEITLLCGCSIDAYRSFASGPCTNNPTVTRFHSALQVQHTTHALPTKSAQIFDTAALLRNSKHKTNIPASSTMNNLTATFVRKKRRCSNRCEIQYC